MKTDIDPLQLRIIVNILLEGHLNRLNMDSKGRPLQTHHGAQGDGQDKDKP
ncbi:hypothetical protein D3C81_893760 [compost metagenome]